MKQELTTELKYTLRVEQTAVMKPRPVEAVQETPLSKAESALLLSALFALMISLASFTTL